MRERSLERPSMLPALASLVLAAGVATLAMRFGRQRLLRVVGFWSYVAAVKKGWPEPGLLRAVGRIDADAVVPYWGRRAPEPAVGRPPERYVLGRAG